MRKKIGDLGVPPVGEFLQMLVDGGAKLYGCKMTVDMMKLNKDDFIPGVIDVVSAADFIDMTEGAEVIFI
jgi:peroxiredoxin family protein